jgi:hypothetical protein
MRPLQLPPLNLIISSALAKQLSHWPNAIYWPKSTDFGNTAFGEWIGTSLTAL